MDSASAVFTALMWFIRAGENNEIQTQVAAISCNKTPENAGVGWPSFKGTRTRCSLFWVRQMAKSGHRRIQMGNKLKEKPTK